MIARLSCLCSFHNSEISTPFIRRSSEWLQQTGTRVLTNPFLPSSVFVIVAATWAKLPGTRSLIRVTKTHLDGFLSFSLITMIYDTC